MPAVAILNAIIGAPISNSVDTGAPDFLFEDNQNYAFEDGTIFEFEN